MLQAAGHVHSQAVDFLVIPPDGRLLVLANGAYGERMLQIAERLKIDVAIERWPEDQSPDSETVRKLLAAESPPTHVAIVHLETTTGILNPLDEIARLVRERGCRFIVDAMSSFGGVPIDFSALQPAYLVSSANKCLEGVPGFSYVLARVGPRSTAGLRAAGVRFWRNGKGSTEWAISFHPTEHALLGCPRPSRSSREGGTPPGPALTRKSQLHSRGMRRRGPRIYRLERQATSHLLRYRGPALRFAEFYHRSPQGMALSGKVSREASASAPSARFFLKRGLCLGNENGSLR